MFNLMSRKPSRKEVGYSFIDLKFVVCSAVKSFRNFRKIHDRLVLSGCGVPKEHVKGFKRTYLFR